MGTAFLPFLLHPSPKCCSCAESGRCLVSAAGGTAQWGPEEKAAGGVHIGGASEDNGRSAILSALYVRGPPSAPPDWLKSTLHDNGEFYCHMAVLALMSWQALAVQPRPPWTCNPPILICMCVLELLVCATSPGLTCRWGLLVCFLASQTQITTQKLLITSLLSLLACAYF